MSRLAYIGNFEPRYSTENFVAEALELLGHDLERFQESDKDRWRTLDPRGFDAVLWTRTDWQWPLQLAHDIGFSMLDAAAAAGVPTIAIHLDRWWGLRREYEVDQLAFFRCDWVFTADGGHDEHWKRVNVNHRWMPPAISEVQADLVGRARPEYRFDVVFVGSWQGGYHHEWAHRAQLVDWLRKFGSTSGWWVRFIPEPHQPAVRGRELSDLYASVGVAVGDSCLSGGARRYWSDRLVETMGRGAFLLHPWVEGMEECYERDQHFATWQLGEWDHLAETLERYLRYPRERHAVAEAGRVHTRLAHTWTVRMRQVLGEVGLS